MCYVNVGMLTPENLIHNAQFRKENKKYDLEYTEISHF